MFFGDKENIAHNKEKHTEIRLDHPRFTKQIPHKWSKSLAVGSELCADNILIRDFHQLNRS